VNSVARWTIVGENNCGGKKRVRKAWREEKKCAKIEAGRKNGKIKVYGNCGGKKSVRKKERYGLIRAYLAVDETKMIFNQRREEYAFIIN